MSWSDLVGLVSTDRRLAHGHACTDPSGKTVQLDRRMVAVISKMMARL